MRKTMMSASLGACLGAGATAYLLMNKKTKRKTAKIINSAVEEAEQMMKNKNKNN